MTTVNAADVARTIDSLLDRVRGGEAVSISEGGREVARLVPSVEQPAPPPAAAPNDPAWQADRDAWLERRRKAREKMTVLGEPMSELVIRLRREARY